VVRMLDNQKILVLVQILAKLPTLVLRGILVVEVMLVVQLTQVVGAILVLTNVVLQLVVVNTIHV
jgi:hypothetical protein